MRWRKRMHQLNTMAKERRLPVTLASRLRSYFLQNRRASGVLRLVSVQNLSLFFNIFRSSIKDT